MWLPLRDACLLPFTWNGDTAQCWAPADHDGDCADACHKASEHRPGFEDTPWTA